MKKPEIPQNETQRLAALCALDVLDTPTEERFDRYTRIAQRHFGVPIALVSLVDTDRQWFKSRQGLGASETPREISFCGHAILSEDIFYIPDTLQDPRFADNPLVTSEPKIRFYAGAPLHAPNGQRIGTLCIIDDKPREFPTGELSILRDLADAVEAELNRTKLLAAAKDAAQLAKVAEYTDNAVIITDAKGITEWVNKGFERVSGYTLEEVIGKKPGEVLHGPDTDPATVAYMSKKMRAGKAFTTEILNYHKNGTAYWLALEIQPVTTDGKLTNFIAIESDITGRKLINDELSRFKHVLDNTWDMIFMFDSKSMQFNYLNKGAVRSMGYSRDELLQMHPYDIKPEIPKDQFLQLIEPLITGEAGVLNFETVHRRKNGEDFPVVITLQLVRKNAESGRFVAVVHDITERKAHENKLLDAEQRIRAVIETVVDGIVTIDSQGVICSFNPAAELLFGYSENQVKGHNVKMLMPEPFRTEHDGYLINYLTTGKRKIIGIGREVTGQRKDGSTFPMELAVNEMQVSGKRMFTGIVRNISERKQAEHELEEASRLRQAILDSANFSIISTNNEGIIQTFNKGAQKLLGYSELDVVGKLTPAVLHDLDEVVNQSKQLSEELGEEVELGFETFVARARCGIGVADENEWTYIRKDGSRVPVMLSVTALRNHKGVITGFLGIASDLTQKRQAEQQQRDAQNRISAIFENVIDSIITINDKGIIETANPATVNVFGYKLDEIVGQNIKMLMPAPYHEEHDGYLQRYKDAGEARVIGIGREVVGRRRDGSTFPMELAVSKMDVSGKQMFTGIVRDITERKQAEESLRQAKEEAERNNRMKSEFLNMMSHELRTPLTVIVGYLPLLKDEAQMPEPAMIATMAKDMAASSSHLMTLINDLLDLSKIEAGKMSLNAENLSSRELVQSVLDNLSNYAREKGIVLVNQVMDENFIVDAVRIKQIFINLVGNAIKFTEQGSITVSSQKRDNKLEFKVIDTGCGIPADDLPHIFDKFRQVDSTSTREAGGTGLGLAITQKLVELHGGEIQVTSQPGAGTIFTFTIANLGIIRHG